jgi:ABC-2 type transport system permease protein
MRAFVAIVIKDLKVRFASPVELVFFLVLPLVFTVVLTGASMGGGAGRPREPLVLLQDTAHTPASAAFGLLLGGMPGIRLRVVTDPTELIGSSEPDLLLTVTPGGAEATDGGGLPFGLMFRLSPWRGSAAATAEKVGAWLEAARGGRETEGAAAATPSAAAATAPAATPTATPGATPTATPTAAPRASGPSAAATGNAGQIITWALVPLLGLGAGLLGERRRGTLMRVRSTPAPRAVVTAASMAAEALGALVQIGILAGFGALVFGLPWLAHPVELLVLSAAFCVAGASGGLLLGAICRTPRQAGSLGLAVALVLAVLGGCWYPAAFFPAGLRAVTRLDPAGWAMDGFLAVLSTGPVGSVPLHSAALLAGFAAAAALLASLLARSRRASAA